MCANYAHSTPPKFLKVIKKWENASGSKSLRTVIRLVKFLFFMLYSTHGAACFWMGSIYTTNKCFEDDLVNGTCICESGWGNKDCLNRNWLSVYDPTIVDSRIGGQATEKYLVSACLINTKRKRRRSH